MKLLTFFSLKFDTLITLENKLLLFLKFKVSVKSFIWFGGFWGLGFGFGFGFWVWVWGWGLGLGFGFGFGLNL
mgnify:CR=1 FL=1